MKNEDLIGRKFIGFDFSKEKTIGKNWCEPMKKHIGKELTVSSVANSTFLGETWVHTGGFSYPKKLVIKNLIIDKTEKELFNSCLDLLYTVIKK